MNKILTDIYGSIYVTDKTVLALHNELRKQKRITNALIVGLASMIFYAYTDLKCDVKQNEKIKALENDIYELKNNK